MNLNNIRFTVRKTLGLKTSYPVKVTKKKQVGSSAINKEDYLGYFDDEDSDGKNPELLKEPDAELQDIPKKYLEQYEGQGKFRQHLTLVQNEEGVYKPSKYDWEEDGWDSDERAWYRASMANLTELQHYFEDDEQGLLEDPRFWAIMIFIAAGAFFLLYGYGLNKAYSGATQKFVEAASKVAAAKAGGG